MKFISWPESSPGYSANKQMPGSIVCQITLYHNKKQDWMSRKVHVDAILRVYTTDGSQNEIQI
jgi:hypothetical protein